ncbi:hypothetical protein FNF27_08070 [Cafeteria roenbergensis]|uniref:Uncharacterized protein n=2 Tax=Cafeteria roenbergensis TaxID=33653 RepID=A0A5A8DES1_CAFRO|nr:hypothetical protein FNF31_06832 [Cafeteria roenbergensis]KAA0162361.1 hypothetical protein FNF27_08070 [Cafeteria roenbergensis]KAA0167553.1 hypothetical protein FNF28_02767 [Cafeteria roenbergensis]
MILGLAILAASAAAAGLRPQPLVTGSGIKTLFTQYEAAAVYDSAGVTTKGYAVGATWLNEPEVAEIFNVTSGNKTVKSINDPNFHDESVFKMDIAQQGTRSVVSKTANGEFFSTIYLLDAATPTSGAEWNMTLPGTEVLAIAISDDGSTVAVAALAIGPTFSVFVLDATSGQNRTEYAWPLAMATTSVQLSMSADGAYVGVLSTQGPRSIKVDVIHSSGAHSGPIINASITSPVAQAFGMSFDGTFVAAGQATDLIVWKRAAGSPLRYQQAFQTTMSDFYVGAASISFAAKAQVMSVAWQLASNSQSQNIVQVYDVVSGKAGLNLTLPATTGSLVNWPTGTALSGDGSFAVMCCWGAEGRQAGAAQLQVFDVKAGKAAGSVYTPGSMFACGVADLESSGRTVAIAAGKHTHATVMGRGGDLVAVELTAA